jgi:lipid A ethanolaminephosphotransferase
MRNHKHVRYLFNPLNVLYGGGKLAADLVPRARQDLRPIGLDARLGPSHAATPHTPLVVLVVGATARAANFSLGAYGRKTNPQLEQLRAAGNLTYFTEVRSCGTNTQASVPCMFSHLGKQAYEAGRQPYENLLDVLHRAGLAVLWLDNQSGCKGLCARVDQVITRTLEDPALCSGGECFDEIMLKDLDQRIAALDPARRARGVVVVMHQMGSHGPAYYRRSPAAFKKFMPECASNVLQDCPREQLVNAYDNTILYTDHLLASTVSWLEREGKDKPVDTALVYVSDHGESLGENNLYLHGLPYALAPQFQVHVPMLTWLSTGMQKRTGVRQDCLQKNAAQPLTHDNLFHSMLGLLDVNTALYQPGLDLFSACR